MTQTTNGQSPKHEPHVIQSGGETLRTSFDQRTGVFDHVFRHEWPVRPTELYIPQVQYPDGFAVRVTDGTYEIDRENERVIYRHSEKDIPHFVRVIPTPPRAPLLRPFWPPRIALGMALLVVLWLLLRPRRD